jgi:hypothetical protein
MRVIDIEKVAIRPRFSFHIGLNPEKLKENIQFNLDHQLFEVTGHIVMDNATLSISPEHRHYWSPQMSFRIENVEDNPNVTLIQGLIGPMPNVWTMFMFFYFLLGVAGLFLSLFGLSKWSLGDYHWAVWGLPIALVLMSTAYLSSKYGERLGHDQVEILKAFMRYSFALDASNEDSE